MRRLTVDIIEDFINELDLSSEIVSASNDGTNTTITVEDTYHTRPNRSVLINGDAYTVVSVDYDNNIIVVEGIIAFPVTFSVPIPFYFHGTPIATSNHISHLQDSDQVPMIYLYEILAEEEQSVLSGIQRESDIRLFFLDNCNAEDWLTDDHYSYRLRGLNRLVDAFIDQIQDDGKRFFTEDLTFTRINHADWGNFVTNKGHMKRLFNGFYTGVELSFTLPIKKCTCC